MDYINAIISAPTLTTSSVELDIRKADTNFFSFLIWEHPEVINKEVEEIKASSSASVHIVESNRGIFSQTTEGDSLSLEIGIHPTLPTDVTVDWTISYEGSVPSDMVEDLSCTIGGFDYGSLHTPATVGDILTISGTAIVPAGMSSVTTTIGTLDDGVFTGGKNSFKVCTATLVSSSASVNIHHNKSIGLIMDSSVVPAMKGGVPIQIKMHQKLPYENLDSPSTGTQEKFTVEDPRTICIDDSPAIKVKFSADEILPVDEMIDLSGGNTYYQIIVQQGRR